MFATEKMIEPQVATKNDLYVVSGGKRPAGFRDLPEIFTASLLKAAEKLDVEF
jgi:hypothetical protein